jgi:uncharacterized protein (UPF0335 family)
MTEVAQEREVLTQETLFEKLVALFNEVWELEMDIKALLDEAKEDGVDEVTMIKSIAKAKAYSKVGDLEQKAKDQLEMIERLVG